MNTEQGLHLRNSSPAHRTTSVDNKALKHPYKNFHQSSAFNSSWSTNAVGDKALQHPDKSFHQAPAFNASWSPATEFSELVAESRAHQLQKQLDPRWHLLAVLARCKVKSGTIHDLRPPPRMLAADPLGVLGGTPSNPCDGNFREFPYELQPVPRVAVKKFLSSRASKIRQTKTSPPQSFAGSFSSLLPSELSRRASVEESPPSAGSQWEGYRESRRCSRDTYPETYITEYTSI